MNGWHDQETILGRFRDWLDEAQAEATALDELSEPAPDGPDLHPVGLYEVVEALTALRHEAKLQTKSGRQLQEQTQEMLGAMREAIEQFRAVEAKESAAALAAARPLAEAIVDLHEALERCQAAIETARGRFEEETASRLADELAELETLRARQSWWRRWLCRQWHQDVQGLYQRRAGGPAADLFASLCEGLGLVTQRLGRVMKEQKLTRIECLGQQADPSCMTVLDVVDDSRRPSGLVLEEVRRGYFWKGKVLRFAEVRAVRNHD